MTPAETDRLVAWLVRRGLEGTGESDLLRLFCEKCGAAGLPVNRGLMFMDTLHPVHEGRIFFWRNDGGEDAGPVRDYGPSNQGEMAAAWQRSPFFHLLQTGGEELRRRIGFGDAADYVIIQEMKDAGHTDYVLFVHRFAAEGTIGEMDCFYSAWSTKHADGFTEANIEALRRLAPALGLAAKSASLARIAGTLVDVYLGRDAGQRVLQGRIQRGIADRIEAVLWFSDLRSFTAITDTARPVEIIPLLNDYAEAVITSIHQEGGDVLKLIGDGTLAIFRADDRGTACVSALRAEAEMRRRVAELNDRRKAAERPTTSVYVGLHVGAVFYGNIGSVDRLDFTVVGPAVNETSRIASMCRSVDRPLLISSAFASALPEAERATLVSVGRFALRGVGRAQELYTLDPENLLNRR
ncbi:MAG: adenylate/guanylate cyclase domain-containing protein [Reyranella sp.]|uniref:adenylate/guanylate cyclase domain-containing protein n=1 Tax=Reyranella sp. TaxID=1929291 RepID=UPI001ACE8B9C|nr:adenylate/guanylate cyclase domain-containing protein [Reyranella sp.]MBN9089414.1 adenylate/guanylate cyclase domain-containing protein [Reyranella sp.]